MRRHPAQAVLVVAALAFVAGCGPSAKSATFHPADSEPASPSAAGQQGSHGPGSLARPPFGRNVRVHMTSWMPAGTRAAQAVIADKNFELAYLYAEYTGGKDRRWTAYVSRRVLRPFAANLAKPDVTTESFRGILRYTHMRAFRDPVHKAAIDVSACYDNSRAENTSIRTGQVIPDRTPAAEHYFRYTDILAQSGTGSWLVIGNYPAVYYPRARECKP